MPKPEPTLEELIEWVRGLPANTKLSCEHEGCDWFTWNMTPLFLNRADPESVAKKLQQHNLECEFK